MTDAEIVAAARFAAWTLMLAKVLLVSNVIYRCDMAQPLRSQIAWLDSNMRTILLGIVFSSAGWTLHQLYWWLAEIAGTSGRADIQRSLGAASIVTVGFYGLVFLGCVMIFSGWLHQYAGRYWPAAGAGIVAALLIIGGLSA